MNDMSPLYRISLQCWLACGNSFFRLPNKNARELLSGDQRQLDTQVNVLRSRLKDTVNTLKELEGQEQLKGFDLKPLSREELAAVSETANANAKPTPMYYFK